MYLLKYLPLAFAALACATPTSHTSKKATADQVIKDINVIRQKTVALNEVATPYQGGRGSLGQALDIDKAGKEVSKAIKQAIKDAKSAAPFTEDEALNIGAATIDLNPVVINVLDTFKSKRAAFDNPYHLSKIVRKTLEDQKEITVELSNAIIAKVPANLQEAAKQISQPSIDKFDEVIAVYSS